MHEQVARVLRRTGQPRTDLYCGPNHALNLPIRPMLRTVNRVADRVVAVPAQSTAFEPRVARDSAANIDERVWMGDADQRV